jgi:AcrR family transcriptional regulator
VEDILAAASRVLTREGGAAFTTLRVAEVAGVSVGSLYQYFPNKESILNRLQVDEWAATALLLEGIFTDEGLPPAERLRVALHAFFRTECDEAPLRRALGDAAPLYRDAPQAREHRARGERVLSRLIASVSPGLSPRRRAFAVDLYMATMSAMGKHVSETVRTRATSTAGPPRQPTCSSPTSRPRASGRAHARGAERPRARVDRWGDSPRPLGRVSLPWVRAL